MVIKPLQTQGLQMLAHFPESSRIIPFSGVDLRF